MTSEIFIVPENGRYWLYNQSNKRVGSRFGYLTKRKAESARWFLINGRDAIAASYKMKREMNQEYKHFKLL